MDLEKSWKKSEFIEVSMWLLNVGRDETVKVIDFEGGDRMRTKLAQYGLYAGDLARVIRVGPIGGPVLIEVSGREIALGRGIAARIRVEPA